VEIISPSNEASLGFQPGTRQATASALVGGGLISGINITNAGSGYTSAPLLSFSGGGGGSGAAATAVLGFSVGSIAVTNGGGGYGAAPTVTISAPNLAGGTTAVASCTVVGGVITNITLSNAGSGYTVAPTITIAAPPAGVGAVQAVAQSQLTATGIISAVTITNAGSGYLSVPSVVLSGGGGSNGALTVTGVTAVGINSIVMVDNGAGYASTAPTVTLSGGGGTGAILNAVLSSDGDLVSSVNIANAGSGYVSNPTVIISPPAGVVVVKARISGTASLYTTTFMVDGKTVGKWEHASNEISNSWTPPQPGSYFLTAQTKDSFENVTTSLPVRVFVEGTSITSPVSSTIVPRGSSVVVTAEATKAQGFIKQVDFYVNGVFYQTDTVAPYSVLYTPSSNGTFNLSAQGIDNTGAALPLSANTPITVVDPIGSIPTVSIINPISSSSLSAGTETNIIADARDSDGFISKVEFYVNGVLQGTDQTFPYSVAWKPEVAGSYALVAMAFDDKSNAVSSAASAVTVVAGFPTISISNPGPGSPAIVKGGKLPITVLAAGADGGIGSLSSITLLIDGLASDALPKNPLGLDPPPPLTEPFVFEWTSNVTVGAHKISARVVDNKGLAVTSSEVTVTVVENLAPVVSIINPLDGSASGLNQVITVNATASDPDGSISKVAINVNGTLIKEVSSAPFSATYTPTSSGVYSFQAIATDNLGKTQTSSIVGVTVSPPIGKAPYVGVAITDPSLDFSATPPAAKTTPVEVIYGSSMLVTAAAVDEDGSISNIEFYVNGTKVGEDSVAPYNFRYDVTSVGDLEFVAVATDNSGNRVSSSPKRAYAFPASPRTTSVTVDSPKPNAVYNTGEQIVFVANSSLGNASAQKIDFYVGNSQMATVDKAPYEYIVGLSSAGSYEVRAVTRLGSLIKVSDPVMITVSAAPLLTVSLLTPTSGQQLVAGVPTFVSAQAADTGNAILSVDLMVDGKVIKTLNTPPYSTSWIPPAPGSYSLTAAATNTVERRNVSDIVRVTAVSSAAPSVSLAQPSNAISYKAGNNISLLATASDSDGFVSTVSFYANGQLIKTLNASPFTIPFTLPGPGVFAFVAEAVDNSGTLKRSDPVYVNVGEDSAPVVSVSNPSPGQSLALGSALTLGALAYNPDAQGIDPLLVDFYANGRVVGVGTAVGSGTSLYSALPWTPPSSGVWQIIAKATNKSGRLSYSSSISVQVTDSNGPLPQLTGVVAGDSYVLGSTVPLTASVTLKSGTLQSVEFYANDALLGVLPGSAELSLPWKPSGTGTYVLSVKATDSLGRSAVSSPLTITVSSGVQMLVSLPTLSTGTYGLGSILPLTALVSSADSRPLSVAKVSFYINGLTQATGVQQIGTNIYEAVAWVPGLPGTYVVSARAVDTFGNIAVSPSSTITVQDTPVSTLKLNGLSDGSQLVSGTQVALDAEILTAGTNIAKYEYYANTTLLASRTPGSSSSYVWAPLGVGSYALKIVATDILGRVSSSAVVNVQVVANEAPVVSMITPAANAQLMLGNEVLVSARAIDRESAVAKVEFLLNGLVSAQGVQRPGTNIYEMPAWIPDRTGSYTFVARATDSLGKVTLSAAAAVTINDVALATLKLSGLSEGSQLISGTQVSLGAEILSSGTILSKYDYYANNTLIGSKPAGAETNLLWNPVGIGSFAVKVVVTDVVGRAAESAVVNVQVVSNEAPVVSLITPTANVQLKLGNEFLVSAQAIDREAAVAKVEFLLNGFVYAQGVQRPGTNIYEMPAWIPDRTGSYTWVAKATDSMGKVTLSAAAPVTVTDVALATLKLSGLSEGSQLISGTQVSLGAEILSSGTILSKYDYYANNTLIGSKLAGAETNLLWNPVGVGSFAVKVVVTDVVGRAAESAVVNVQVVSNEAPVVSLITPAINAQLKLGNEVLVSARAIDREAAVAKVEFLLNGFVYAQGVLRSGTNIYEMPAWIPDRTGTYTWVAKATDSMGKVTLSAAAPVTVSDVALATLKLMGLSEGSQLISGTQVSLGAEILSSGTILSKYDYYANNTLIGSKPAGAETNLLWNPVGVGNFAVKVVVTDVVGRAAESAVVNVQVVSNEAPVVSLITPAVNAQLKLGNEVLVSARAIDREAAVAKVEFLLNGFLYAQGVQRPGTSIYEMPVWIPDRTGTYTWVAKATDSMGKVTLSAAAPVTVSDVALATLKLSGLSEGSKLISGTQVSLGAEILSSGTILSKYDYYANNTLIGSKPAGAETNLLWNPVGVGFFAVKVVVTDVVGRAAESAVVNVEVMSNEAPVVSLISPLPNAQFDLGSSVQITARAIDRESAVSKVEFLLNGFTYAQGVLRTGSNIYDMPVWIPDTAGTYTWVARATDNLGKQTLSAASQIVIKDVPLPVLKLMGLNNGSRFLVGISLSLGVELVSARTKILKYDYYANAELVASSTSNDGLNVTWTPRAAGSYDLKVVASDVLGRTTSSALVAVQVDQNLVPSVSLISPAKEQTSSIGTSIKILAQASDTDGSISKVELLVNDQVLTSLVSAPWEYNWKPSSAGTYRLSARATDNLGLVSAAAAERTVVVEDFEPGKATAYYIGQATTFPFEAYRISLLMHRGFAYLLATSVADTRKAYCWLGQIPDQGNRLRILDDAGHIVLDASVNDTGVAGVFNPDGTGNRNFIIPVVLANSPTAVPGFYAGTILGNGASEFYCLVDPAGGINFYLSDGKQRSGGSGQVLSNGTFLAGTSAMFNNEGVLVPSGTLISGTVAEGLLKADCSAGFITGKVSAALQTGASLSDSSLLGISTRAWVGTGDKVMIAGLIVDSSTTMNLVLRGLGKSTGLGAHLDDPAMETYTNGLVIPGASNDNWSNTPETLAQLSAMGLGTPVAANEAMSISSVAGGAYTVVLHGKANQEGNGMVEVYRSESFKPYAISRLKALSTRTWVGTGDNRTMISFIIQGSSSLKVLFRAIGPGLESSGMRPEGLLADPVLNLVRVDQNKVIRENNDWELGNAASMLDAASAQAGIAPLRKGSKDAGMVLNLVPGVYSAVVEGKSGGSGVCILEIYELR
jgi:hypothetical protein